MQNAESSAEELRLAIQQLYLQEMAKPTLEEIRREIFEPVLQQFPGSVIVVDGISNANGSAVYSIVSYFRKLLKRMYIKVLISTRSDLDLPEEVSRIYLTNSIGGSLPNDIDIRSYVDAKLDVLARPGKLLADASLRALVKSELLRNAKGMYGKCATVSNDL